MNLELLNASSQRWAAILAGGDGKRLLPLTRILAGDERPKQFCPIIAGETLLERTRRRIAGIIPSRQTLLVLTQDHEPYYRPQLENVPEDLRVVQPYNRGTAPAIVYTLLRLRAIDPRASVAFFPSDHDFLNEGAFLEAVERTFESIESQPKLVTLLGLAPDSAEAAYGWIEPGAPLLERSAGFSRVRRFWEKPSPPVARTLMRNGCLWNSFVMAGRVDAFLGMVEASLPDLLQCFEAVQPALGTNAEMQAIRRVYEDITPADFSRDVLTSRPEHLAVVRLENMEWSDLGDPERVRAAIERHDLRAKPSQREEELISACAHTAVA